MASSRTVLPARRVVAVLGAGLLAAGLVGATAAPAQARVRPYVIGNTVTEPDPEITVSRLGTSDADGLHLRWLAGANLNTHHADASRDARTYAYLQGTNSVSGGSRVNVRIVVRRNGHIVFTTVGLISPPDVTPDGRYVVWGQGRRVYRFDAITHVRRVLYTAPVGDEVETVGYSPDRTRLLVTAQGHNAAGPWKLRLVRTSDSHVLLSRVGLFSDLYERPEWSPTSSSVLVFWHAAAVAPRAVRVSRAGGVFATAIVAPLRSLNWRPDGVYALDPVANVVKRTNNLAVAPVLAWLRLAPGRVLDNIVLVDRPPA
jgi:hypothetical protein